MIDFPNNPNVGDIFPTAQITYRWNGTGWRVAGGSASALGGMNLVNRMPLTGQTEHVVLLDPNFDYVFVMDDFVPTLADKAVQADVSEDGGSTWTAANTWDRNGLFGSPVFNTSGNAVAANNTNAPCNLTNSMSVLAVPRTGHLTVEIYRFGEAAATFLHSSFLINESGNRGLGEYRNWHQSVAVHDAVRFRLQDSDTFAQGWIDVYRRSRQPISFLTGREPGGMYLFQSVDLTGLAQAVVPLLAGYDYDLEVRAPVPSVEDGILVGNFSIDGGSTWKTGSDSTASRVGVSNVETPTGAVIVSGLGVVDLLFSGKVGVVNSKFARSDIQIRSHDSATLSSVAKAVFSNYDQFGFVYDGVYHAVANNAAVDNAMRILFDNGSFAAGTLDIYRRNRALTFS